MKSALILLEVCFLTLSVASQKEVHVTNVAAQQQKKISLSRKEFQQKLSIAMNQKRQNVHTHEVVGSWPQNPHYAAMRYYGPDDSSCQGDQIEVVTVLLDTCLKSNKEGDSVKYSCCK